MTRLSEDTSLRTARRALDLFAGAGGLGYGFEWAGGRVIGAVEVDEAAASTFRQNHPHAKVWTTDVRQITPAQIVDLIGPVDVIIGGPMCQGVSQRGPRDPHRDKRNFAFWVFTQFIRELKPDFFLMENVPALLSDVHNRTLAIALFEELESLGYHLACDVVNAAWLGVPQLRYRCIVMGSKGHQPNFPDSVMRGVAGRMPEIEYVTVGDALMDLPSIPAGGGTDIAAPLEANGDLPPYTRMMRETAHPLYNHWSADTDEVNLRRIRHVPEGGNWHDIPRRLLPARFSEVRPSDHTTTYRRLDRIHPAHTITTECGNVTSGSYTHPKQDRAISVREAARLQGFPDRFRFIGPKGSQYRQVGNAVPPLMAKQLFEALFESTSGFRGRISADLLARHPNSRLPFTLAPRYRPLFGKNPGSLRKRRKKIA